ncbi:hypothetical protein [Paraburkholderia ultramafica]|uniref:hypothetical protein n=1 Tax=Paraburkholderia ultramafica TaxID=1544867 RepID=UPI0015817D2B|nr:hypothetical protein [Paraburkholderia ultramafica]
MKYDVLNTRRYDATSGLLVAIRHRNLAVVPTLRQSQRRNKSFSERKTVIAKGKRLPRGFRRAHVPLVFLGGLLQ